MEQGVLRVVAFRKTPLNAKIGTESNDEHSFPTLWDTEVRRVEQTEHNVVLGARSSGGMMPLESCAVVARAFRLPPSHARMRKPQEDVFEVGRKGLAHQPLDVFEEKRLRPQLLDRAHREVDPGIGTAGLVVRFINTLTFSSCTQRQNMAPYSTRDGTVTDAASEPLPDCSVGRRKTGIDRQGGAIHAPVFRGASRQDDSAGSRGLVQ